MAPDLLIHNTAAKQGGIVLTEQALESGLTPEMIRYRVRGKRWKPVTSGVYRIFEMNASRDVLRAAVIALPGAVVSHESAASLRSIPMVDPSRPTVTVHSRTTHVFPGVQVHRNHDLLPQHVSLIDDLPVTTVPRTVVDLAATLSPKHIEFIVDDLLAAGRLTTTDLQAVHDSVAGRGKPGSASIRAILEERSEGAAHPQSRLETRGLTLLTDAALPAPESEYPMPWNPRRRFDLAFPRHRLAIEWDSRRWHSQVDAFERDRRRDRLALLNGWRVLRFTWSEVVERPAEVVSAVRRALKL